MAASPSWHWALGLVSPGTFDPSHPGCSHQGEFVYSVSASGCRDIHEHRNQDQPMRLNSRELTPIGTRRRKARSAAFTFGTVEARVARQESSASGASPCRTWSCPRAGDAVGTHANCRTHCRTAFQSTKSLVTMGVQNSPSRSSKSAGRVTTACSVDSGAAPQAFSGMFMPIVAFPRRGRSDLGWANAFHQHRHRQR